MVLTTCEDCGHQQCSNSRVSLLEDPDMDTDYASLEAGRNTEAGWYASLISHPNSEVATLEEDTIKAGENDADTTITTVSLSPSSMIVKPIPITDDNSRKSMIDDKLSIALIAKLCAMGFLINFQPSEPYLTKYLKDFKGFSDDKIDNHIWPYDTYGSLIFLLPIGLAAEHIGFRTVIMIGLLCREATRLLLIFAKPLYLMSAMQCTYAAATDVNIVYFAYIYMVVSNEKHFYTLTAAINAAYHLGNFISSLMAQALVTYTSIGDHLKLLFYASWVFTSLGIVSFFWLPKPVRSSPASLFKVVKYEGCNALFAKMHFLYTENIVRLWSIWWIGAYSSYALFRNYYQSQFTDLDENGSFGLMEAFIELACVIGATIPAYRKSYLTLIPYSFAIALFSSLGLAALLYGSTLATVVTTSYICNICAFGLYQFQNSVASACIAFGMATDNYAIVFTINTFIALVITTVVQAIGTVYNWSTVGYYYASVFFACSVVIGLLFGITTRYITADNQSYIVRRRTKISLLTSERRTTATIN